MNSITDKRNPVLLVHGIFDTGRVFYRMVLDLTRKGWNVHTIDLKPNCGEVGLDELAQQIKKYIDKNFAPEQPIDIVGFSMGGIVSRYYVQRLGGIQRTQRFITISSPHNGTWIAYLRPGIGCSQMRPNSEFLADLNQDIHILEKVQFTSMWTPYDLMILPPQSSQVPVGEEVILPVMLHAWMIKDTQSIEKVGEILKTPLIQDECHQFADVAHHQK
ncbi:esterase/lipase family protein [Calothrix sp. 336/3]|uniref:esterase/lipase family protein n=1 Tax=Calothrix sp. 336/3 TaxID=1337936 RepID=UPI0004E2C5B0|nr:triacylglycerol lipase [Calothrix sp. 336/3]AKG24693.1 lipase class 2 [Calothrix sp. 336/3]